MDPTGAAIEHELWQSRLSRFGRVLAVVCLLYPGLNIGFSLWLHRATLFSLVSVLPLLASVTFAALWLLLRGAPRTRAFVLTVELSTLFVGTGALSAMALVLPLVSTPESVVRGALTYMLFGYAVYVPSTARRMLVVASLMTLPLLTCVFLAYRAWDPALHEPPVGLLPKNAAVGQIAPSMTVYCFIWWAVAVAMATAFSRALYGLRKQASDNRRLGQYTLEEKLGEGGMGVVYRATHAMLRRPAAIKLLLPDRTGPTDLARFEREVQQTSRLAHPNTISIFDYGRSAEGVFYYVMEYLDGFDLDELVESDGPLSPARAIHVLAQASGALAEAHALGLIHRDIKPANLVLTERADESDVVKVVDFGLVRTLAPEKGEAAVTNANTITGTPMYMAPEAIMAPDSVDARADLYALGAVGYYLLTGQHVFEGATVLEVCSKHLLEAPVAPSLRLGKPLAQDIEGVVLGCLAKRREDRPATAHALREALLACGDAARYDVEAARAWWRERGAVLRARPKSAPSEGHATMAVDLRGRDESLVVP